MVFNYYWECYREERGCIQRDFGSKKWMVSLRVSCGVGKMRRIKIGCVYCAWCSHSRGSYGGDDWFALSESVVKEQGGEEEER